MIRDPIMLFHGGELVVSPSFERMFSSAGVSTVEGAFRAWCPDPPRPDRRSRVVEIALSDGDRTARCFFKSYDYAGLWRLRTLFIPARAKREYRNLLGLAALGMNVPRPVAYGQSRRLGLVTSSLLITEAIEPSIDLRELASGRPAPFPMPDRRERRRLIEDFARRLRRCHDAGWFLYTAFFKNLLLSRRADDGYALHLIDVPFAHIWRTRLLPGLARVRDLGCLQQGAAMLLSRTERLRFFRTYSGRARLTGADRRFLRRVDAYQRRNYP